MSVLLEALKKAAENKQQGAESDSASETVPVDNQPVETVEPEIKEAEPAVEQVETVEPDASEAEEIQEAANPLSSIQLINETPSEDSSSVKSIDDLELEFSQTKDDETPEVKEQNEPAEPVVTEESESTLGAVLSESFLKEDNVETATDVEVDLQKQEDVDIASDEPLMTLDQSAETSVEKEASSGELAEDSYAWSLSSLPGYGEGDAKNPSLSGAESVTVTSNSEKFIPEQNPILSSDKRFRKYLPKSLRSMLFGRSSNYTVYTLLSVLVFSFLGLFGILYYQDQSLKLEKSMHKYDIVKMEPYQAQVKIEEKKVPVASEPEEDAMETKLVETELETAHKEPVSEPEPTVSIQKKPKVVQPVKKPVYIKKHIQPKEKKPSVVVNIEAVPVEPYVQNAYQALYAGDFNKAENLFKKALQDNAEDVDALNGLGAVYAQLNQEDQAIQQYYKVLELSSDNIHAFEAIISLVGSGLSGLEWKNEIKRVLVKHPDSAILHYALGNIYAGENDWEKAQSSYFEAHRLDQKNPDYLVNLAISLDHLGQYELAEKYYTLGLVYSESKITNFDVNQVKLRLASIKQYIGQNDL